MKRINHFFRRALVLDNARNRYLAVFGGAAIVAAMLNLLGRHRDFSAAGTLVPAALLFLGLMWLGAGMLRNVAQQEKPQGIGQRLIQSGPTVAGLVACVALVVMGARIALAGTMPLGG
jgi:hypothetical protein